MPVDYQITLDVAKFEQEPDGGIVLDAFWRLVSLSSSKVLVMRRSIHRVSGAPVETTGSAGAADARSYDAVAAAMSRDLETLSHDIANEIRIQKGS